MSFNSNPFNFPMNLFFAVSETISGVGGGDDFSLSLRRKSVSPLDISFNVAR